MDKEQLFSWLLEHANAHRRPAEWCELLGVEMIDDDGWRGRNEQPYDMPCGLEEFMIRVSESTIQ